MSEYVIRRTDQLGGYVTPPGSKRTYTLDARKALRLPSYEAALAACCPENEIPEKL